MKKKNLLMHIATNFALGCLVLSVALACFLPVESETVGGESEIYRTGNESSGGVSLMFNVYWGTDEVYEILETLDEYEAKATFFIGGCWADDNVQCLKDILARGHELGNHGYFHKDHDKLSAEANREEIVRCNQFVALATGFTPTLFAPPSGAYNDDTLSVAAQLNMKTILWTKDTIDWRDKNASLIYTRATKDIKAGAFILMHPMEATANALPDILKYYQSQNLRAITVGENLQAGG
ncbi:MAG: polysaccharide deacetylase family protein [Clostridia bacterium]|nr:polysaccharide deacetylase family protein [Clostridia bacterium]